MTYDLARAILGDDFISPEDIMKSREGIVYKDELLAKFCRNVPSKDVLEWCRDNNYMLVAGPDRPRSLLGIGDLNGDYESYGRKWAAGNWVDTHWITLRKEPVPQSLSKSFREQRTLLSFGEVVPGIARVAWCVTTYKAVRNIYLLPDVYVRTASVVFHDKHDRACAGYYDVSSGLNIYRSSVCECDEHIGVAATKRY